MTASRLVASVQQCGAVDQVDDAMGDENTGFVTEIPVVSLR